VAPRGYKTKLHFERAAAGHTQAFMSEHTGIPLRTYRRLESGELENPPIRYLVNCAIVLAAPLEDVCEDQWLRWTEFARQATGPNRRLKIRGR
jgi:hypothetical protein